MKKIIRFVLNHFPRKYLQRVSHVVLRLLSVFYYGHQVECPVCHHHFRKFLPYGYVNSRENALCPSCQALERHRQIWLFLQRKTNLFQQKGTMLHIAPEFCFIKRFEQLSSLDYYTADLESPLARVKMDIHHIPFEENFFDIIMCNHILEHVDNDRLAMSELYRVMKPNGWGIIQSPVNTHRKVTYENPSIVTPEERLKHFGQKDHQREYGIDYADRLRQAGFRVKEIPLSDFASDLEIKRYALTPNVESASDTTIYYVEKLL